MMALTPSPLFSLDFRSLNGMLRFCARCSAVAHSSTLLNSSQASCGDIPDGTTAASRVAASPDARAAAAAASPRCGSLAGGSLPGGIGCDGGGAVAEGSWLGGIGCCCAGAACSLGCGPGEV